MSHARKDYHESTEEEIRAMYPEFSRLLIAHKSEILERHAQARAQLDQQVVESPGDEADLSVIDSSADYFLKLANTHQKEIVEITEAFDRMHRGAYGICLKCEDPIAVSRLEKLPYARLCVGCQTTRERHALTAFPNAHPKL